MKKLNLSKTICDHLIGEEHTPIHRISVGVVIMVVGVGVAKGSMAIDYAFVHFFGDMLGYFLHGVGAIPIVDKLILKDINRQEDGRNSTGTREIQERNNNSEGIVSELTTDEVPHI